MNNKAVFSSTLDFIEEDEDEILKTVAEFFFRNFSESVELAGMDSDALEYSSNFQVYYKLAGELLDELEELGIDTAGKYEELEF